MKKGTPKKTFSEAAIYVVCGIASLILIIVGACLREKQVVSTILVGVGCSGIAAALMSFALLIRDNNAKKEQIERDRKTLLQRIYSELKYILQRILWFDARMDDDSFNWSYPDEQYATLKYMVYASKEYKESPNPTYDEIKNTLEVITKKYDLEAQKTFDEHMQKKTEKMFRIIGSNSSELLKALELLVDNKLMMNQIGYISLDDIESLRFNILCAIGIMRKPQKNYGVAVKLLLTAYNTIRETGNYSDELTISLQGSFGFSEL